MMPNQRRWRRLRSALLGIKSPNLEKRMSLERKRLLSLRGVSQRGGKPSHQPRTERLRR